MENIPISPTTPAEQGDRLPLGVRQESIEEGQRDISSIFYPKLNLSSVSQKKKKKKAFERPIKFHCPSFALHSWGIIPSGMLSKSSSSLVVSKFPTVSELSSRSERLLPERHVYLHQKHHPLHPSAAPRGPGTASWRWRSALQPARSPGSLTGPRGGFPSPGCLSAPRGQLPPLPLRKQLHSYE